jgi:hypothetical protein
MDKITNVVSSTGLEHLRFAQVLPVTADLRNSDGVFQVGGAARVDGASSNELASLAGSPEGGVGRGVVDVTTDTPP